MIDKTFAKDLMSLPEQLKSLELSINKFKNDKTIVANQLEAIKLSEEQIVMKMSLNPKTNLNSADKRRSVIEEKLRTNEKYQKLSLELTKICQTIDSLYIEFNYLDRRFKAIRSNILLVTAQ